MQSQFSLSLELSNLIPFPKPSILLELARALQKSGSDIVTEDDLVRVFGRNKLLPNFESTFKTVMANSTQETVLSKSLALILEAGAGPTVQRAIKHREHFAMVVQLSMLTWAHERRSLAAAISEAMRRRIQTAPTVADMGSVPGETAVLGVLRVCEEQTALFPWQTAFEAVRMSLGMRSPLSQLSVVERLRETTLSFPVLQASLDMLTAVQYFPENRIMYIQGNSGVVTMVVWAYRLLGLNVSVLGSPLGKVEFGAGKPSVVIDMNWHGSPRACLLEATEPGNNISALSGLILAVESRDDIQIEAAVKYPAKGYGMQILRHSTFRLSAGAIYEMMHVTVAMAMCITEKLEVVHSPQRNDGSGLQRDPPISREGGTRLELPLSYKSNLIFAAKFFFDEHTVINENTVQGYISAFTHQPLNQELTIPPAVNLSLKGLAVDGKWEHLVDTAKSMALLILSLCAVNDISTCDQWPLGNLECCKQSDMATRLNVWDGIKTIELHHDSWYDVLGRMMLGSKYSGPGSSSLISNWGWSMYMSSFGDMDPVAVIPGVLWVKPGVPSRNGERRTSIQDGPKEYSLKGNRDKVIESSGDMTKPRCEGVFEMKTMVGTMDDHFVVTVQFSTKDPNNLGYGAQDTATKHWITTGYREMHRVRWNAFVSDACLHRTDSPLQLPLDAGTATIEQWPGVRDALPRICIALVHRNRDARWMGLMMSSSTSTLIGQSCLECSLSQIIPSPGTWTVLC